MNIYELSEKLGKEAFEAGIMRAPVLDKRFHREIMPIAGKDMRACLSRWTKGWDKANLDAPVPEWSDEENAAWAKRGE